MMWKELRGVHHVKGTNTVTLVMFRDFRSQQLSKFKQRRRTSNLCPPLHYFAFIFMHGRRQRSQSAQGFFKQSSNQSIRQSSFHLKCQITTKCFAKSGENQLKTNSLQNVHEATAKKNSSDQLIDDVIDEQLCLSNVSPALRSSSHSSKSQRQPILIHIEMYLHISVM